MKIMLSVICLFFCLLTTAQKQISLFNGKDLTGWTIHGTEKWYVQKVSWSVKVDQINSMDIFLQIRIIRI
jgi:hypothetical protein